jgi:hypothetical protein
MAASIMGAVAVSIPLMMELASAAALFTGSGAGAAIGAVGLGKQGGDFGVHHRVYLGVESAEGGTGHGAVRSGQFGNFRLDDGGDFLIGDVEQKRLYGSFGFGGKGGEYGLFGG